jgi:hypothetical protein
MVLTDTGDGQASLCSGLFISADGRLITCYHAIASASTIRVITSDAWTDEVVVHGTEPSRNLAILRVTGMRAGAPLVPSGAETPPGAWPPVTLMPPEWLRPRRSAALGAGLIAALDRLSRFIETNATLQEKALNELSRLGNEALDRYSRVADLAAFRYGSGYRLSDLAQDAEQEFLKVPSAYDARAEYYGAQFDALDPTAVLDSLTMEVDRYFARLPQSADNKALRDTARDHIARGFADADAVDARLASRVAAFGRVADSYNTVDTLAELRRDIERAANAYRELLRETAKTGEASSHRRAAMSVIERLFEAQ